MKILVTNDDGIEAAGLAALTEALSGLGDLLVIAPDRPRSASSHAISLREPLSLERVTLLGDVEAYASNGTPPDCVALGLSRIGEERLDLVVSGINRGANLGEDLAYSATVAAAAEAAICGIASFAVSVAAWDEPDFRPAADFARYLSRIVLERGLPAESFLNVNLPNLSASQITGVALTRQGRFGDTNRLERRQHGGRETYHWVLKSNLNHRGQPESDIEAIAESKISVTPIRLDRTDTNLLGKLPDWSLRWPA